MSDAKKTIEINDRATAKAIAARIGLKWPVAQGKPPLSALWYKLTELGFEVTGTYVPKPKKLAPVGAGQREYEITRTHTGKPDDKGVRKPLDKPETIRVSIKVLREILASNGPGTLGDSRIREAVTKLRASGKLFIGWEDADIAKATVVPVVAVETPDENALAVLDAVLTPPEPEQEAAKPAAKAPSKPRASRASAAKGKTPAKSAAPVTEPVTAAAE
jgi:hypothetical protein